MESGWNPFGFHLLYYVVSILLLGTRVCWGLNVEGVALLRFKHKVDDDPYGAFANWNPEDENPCKWSGVHCVDGNVRMLNLTGCSLKGELAPELGKLTHLKSLLLQKNCFFGAIPREIGELKELELLDLRNNNLNGTIPAEIGTMTSLESLLVDGNEIQGTIHVELKKRSNLCGFQLDENTSAKAFAFGPANRKFGHWIWQSRWPKTLNKEDSLMWQIKGALVRYLSAMKLAQSGKDLLHGPERDYHVNAVDSASRILQSSDVVSPARRKLAEQSSNLAAAPPRSQPPAGKLTFTPITRSSGAFPATPSAKKNPSPVSPPSSPSANDQPPPSSPSANDQPRQTSNKTSGTTWKYIIIIVPTVVVLLIIIVAVIIYCHKRGAATIGPWKTGLSGQLQKAFVTGVPKLNRSELETACEDFSNIISTNDGSLVYKGTLSSGVEIAVTSTTVIASKDWPPNVEKGYRKKIDTLSRVNHKNFVNLIGYCEEEEPFTRMMVFEYAPNGTLFEHLHVKDAEHLDWTARVRIIMGVGYCLQHMHDLHPPVAHTRLDSTLINLTDDYAAKVCEDNFFAATEASTHGSEDGKSHSKSSHRADLAKNVYDFGVLLLETISGKLPHSEEQGSLVKWATQYMNDKRSISYLIDPTLKSFKNDELDIICEVIQSCIVPDAAHRPTMKEIMAKLKEVIAISPDQATPKLSPLWWAELEILSVEAT